MRSRFLAAAILMFLGISGCGYAEAQRQAAMARAMAAEAEAQALQARDMEFADERRTTIEAERDQAVVDLAAAKDEIQRLRTELAAAQTELARLKAEAEPEKP